MSLFAVLVVREDINVDVLGLSQKLELSFAEGMVGAIPVFKDKASALAYVKDTGATVIEINEI
jgi:hypothetical protein